MWKISESNVAKIKQVVSSRYPIVYLTAWEEERVEQILKSISDLYFEGNLPLVVWTATRGFYTSESELSETRDPASALRYIASQSDDAIYLMKDLPAYFENNNVLVRMLRDLYSELSNRNTLVVLLHPEANIPEVLKKEIFLIDLGLPDEQEITDFFKHTLSSRNVERTFTEDWAAQCASAMHGLTLNEVRHLVLRLMSEDKLGSEDALEKA